MILFRDGRFVYVDKTAKRFANEAAIEIHDISRIVSIFDVDRFDFPRIPWYAIFDEVTRQMYPLCTGMGFNRDKYEWSSDNSAEIAKGWISQGETIRELARKLSLEESTLDQTVAKYNEYCEIGKDSDFDRAEETLIPIEAPPYYAIKLWPTLINTQGGPRRDKEARVLDWSGKPIPRLYAAGELGSIWGFLYQGAGNISECLVFGRIAGRNAAREEPLSESGVS